MKYLIAMDYESEDFDPDGVGDIVRHDTHYLVKDNEERMLAYLRKNICFEDRTLANFDTIEEYCKEFKFRFYERKY